MRNISIGTRLIGGFTAVAVITLIVGVIGLLGVVSLDHHIEEIGEVRLPSIASLLVLEKEGESIRGAQRTLLNPRLSMADRQRQYRNMETAQSDYRQAWGIYEPLPQTPEEAQLWRRFVPLWEQWERSNDEFVRLSRRVEATGILNPLQLRADL